ncbi:MAG: hypothetical protein A4E73_03609 [Syntrophaceae bacterium PtaU1.Bin231]|nr:MAG: hypothetical protein A4E73_03609 [Syntrophaceae bacterium PtaU1.Bin231]
MERLAGLVLADRPAQLAERDVPRQERRLFGRRRAIRPRLLRRPPVRHQLLPGHRSRRPEPHQPPGAGVLSRSRPGPPFRAAEGLLCGLPLRHPPGDRRPAVLFRYVQDFPAQALHPVPRPHDRRPDGRGVPAGLARLRHPAADGPGADAAPAAPPAAGHTGASSRRALFRRARRRLYVPGGFAPAAVHPSSRRSGLFRRRRHRNASRKLRGGQSRSREDFLRHPGGEVGAVHALDPPVDGGPAGCR